MRRIIFICLLLSFSPYCVSAGQPAVTLGADGKSWTINTLSSVYKIQVHDNGSVNHVFFGDKKNEQHIYGYGMGPEVTVRGGYVTDIPMLEAVFPDQVRDIELTYDKGEVITIDGYPVLVIVQKDKHYPLSVTEYIRVIPEYDLLEKWIEIENTSKNKKDKPIIIENVQSGGIFLPKNEYELTHFSGQWGYEFQPKTTLLTQGVKTLQVRDFKSYGSSFFALRPVGDNQESHGEVWFGILHYSGNWRVDFDKKASGVVQVSGGINFWDQNINLKPGESFTGCKMNFGYTKEGMNGVTQSLTGYTKEKILPESFRNKIRPVTYNSWYVTGFGVNEENQVALAKIASDLGVELFIMDDGWFKGRNSDRAGLGDWIVDKVKFPDGLGPLIKQVNDLGMIFGLWIEPEMVNPESDLYRAHPEWVYNYPSRTRHHGRNQLMLNLAREDVYQYLFKCYSDLLRENNIGFIKIDHNKALTDAGDPTMKSDEQRAIRLKHIENLYRLVDELRKDFPDVWFENCSSGGGRIDLGIMSRMDFNWLSDNTDPVERTFIQYSYLGSFPANTMYGLVTEEDWHRQNPTLDFRFDVSMCGVLGLGGNIAAWNDDQKKIARQKIELYKEIRETVQFGRQYRLLSPYEGNRSILQFVDKGQTESVVFIYNLAEYPRNALSDTSRPTQVKLLGLDPQKNYRIEGLKGGFSGDYLMNVGFDFPLRGTYKSGIFRILAE